MRTYAVDFETYYDATCSLKVQGVWGYLRHPDCDIYMVSVVGDDGTKWVGHPKDFNWRSITGEGTRWIAHNMAFDGAVYDRLIELGHAPEVYPDELLCTADMCAYHGLPRSLKNAIESLFKGEIEVSKDVRNAMKGQRWEAMTPEFQKEASDYALHDSYCCLKLWDRLSATWPQIERIISRHTCMMSWQGLPVDKEKIEDCIQTLKDLIWEAEGKIPWAGTHATLSPKQLAEECRKVGLTPPRSLAQDSEECAEWEDTYGDQYPWVDAMRTVRRGNAMMKKFMTMRDRIKSDGRLDVGLLYCGAHTLRDSGTGGFNIQNLAREAMFGTNMRECIAAAPGKVFVINDLSQIEPRVLTYLAGDRDTLNLLASGMGPYEAHARATMGWTGGKLKAVNPSMYALAKARCLALGYGAGWEKFITMAKNYVSPSEFDQIFKIQPDPADMAAFEKYLQNQSTRKRDGKFTKYTNSPEETKWVAVNSWLQVNEYRASNKKITAFWDRLDRMFKQCRKQDVSIEFPNNRIFWYRDVLTHGGATTCAQVRQGVWTRSKIYGGLAAENLTQSLARDVFMDCVHRILLAGHNIIMRVHDEVVIECDEADAERVMAEVTEIMHTPPSWFPELPLASEGEITRCYKK